MMAVVKGLINQLCCSCKLQSEFPFCRSAQVQSPSVWIGRFRVKLCCWVRLGEKVCQETSGWLLRAGRQTQNKPTWEQSRLDKDVFLDANLSLWKRQDSQRTKTLFIAFPLWLKGLFFGRRSFLNIILSFYYGKKRVSDFPDPQNNQYLSQTGLFYHQLQEN